MDEHVLIKRLSEWPISGIGMHPEGSNYVFVVRLSDPEKYNEATAEDVADNSSLFGIYKPLSGERPLRDFPVGTLHRRERAAYLVSYELGWPKIPPTIIRTGPHGTGSVQLFIDAAGRQDNFFSLRNKRLNEFRDMAMFDVLVHNADRKGGSCIVDKDGQLWAIDHGLTFNGHARRRTVMFEFNGTKYPDHLLVQLESFVQSLENHGRLRMELCRLLQESEIEDMITRARGMIQIGNYPVLDPRTNVPWPMI